MPLIPLKHNDLWRAIDRLAEKHHLSVSGLARKAQLSHTIFNVSKRASATRRRWPSTESIAAILQVTQTSLDEFFVLASPNAMTARTTLPLLGYTEASREGFFDDAGYPVGSGWEEIDFPALADPHAFALEVTGKSMEPLYREGDRIVVSPGAELRRGDRVVVRTKKGEVLVKLFDRKTTQKTDLISLNLGFAPIELALRDVEFVYRIIWVSQ